MAGRLQGPSGAHVVRFEHLAIVLLRMLTIGADRRGRPRGLLRCDVGLWGEHVSLSTISIILLLRVDLGPLLLQKMMMLLARWIMLVLLRVELLLHLSRRVPAIAAILLLV